MSQRFWVCSEDATRCPGCGRIIPAINAEQELKRLDDEISAVLLLQGIAKMGDRAAIQEIKRILRESAIRRMGAPTIAQDATETENKLLEQAREFIDKWYTGRGHMNVTANVFTYENLVEHAAAFAQAKIEQERERCAKIAEDVNYQKHYPQLWQEYIDDKITLEQMVAAAIREGKEEG